MRGYILILWDTTTSVSQLQYSKFALKKKILRKICVNMQQKIEKSIFFGGQKVLDNYCIVISGIMENNEKIINWEIVKKI